jgi:hypothetical protein
MKDEALKLAKIFDEQAEFGFELVLRSDEDTDMSRMLSRHHVQYAKEHQANAELLREMVAEIGRLQEENEALKLELNKKLV